MNPGVAQALLNVFTLVQAGFEFMALQKQVKTLVAEGKSDQEISDWLHNLRVATLNEGSEFFKDVKR